MAFAIDQPDGIIWLTLTGTLSGADLAEISAAVAALEDSLPVIPPRLTDLSGVDAMNVSYADVLALANARRARTFPNAFKSALVVRREVQKGYARMFQTLNDHPKIRIEIFTDVVGAERWLREALHE